MRSAILAVGLLVALLAPSVARSTMHSPMPPQERKDYLT